MLKEKFVCFFIYLLLFLDITIVVWVIITNLLSQYYDGNIFISWTKFNKQSHNFFFSWQSSDNRNIEDVELLEWIKKRCKFTGIHESVVCYIYILEFSIRPCECAIERACTFYVYFLVVAVATSSSPEMDVPLGCACTKQLIICRG